MPIYPNAAQFEALMKSGLDGPIDMLNLLKFKDRAEYEDGRETDLSGREAYMLYGEKMQPFVESNGGKMLYGGAAQLLMIGDDDLEWDMVAIMQYPSKAAFVKIATSPDVAEFGVHRTAGLDHQLLVACTGASFD